MTDATTRFKLLLAGALERVCVLEAELEQAREELAALRPPEPDTDPLPKEARNG